MILSPFALFFVFFVPSWFKESVSPSCGVWYDGRRECIGTRNGGGNDGRRDGAADETGGDALAR